MNHTDLSSQVGTWLYEQRVFAIADRTGVATTNFKKKRSLEVLFEDLTTEQESYFWFFPWLKQPRVRIILCHIYLSNPEDGADSKNWFIRGSSFEHKDIIHQLAKMMEIKFRVKIKVNMAYSKTMFENIPKKQIRP